MNKKIIGVIILTLSILTLALFGCDDGGSNSMSQVATPEINPYGGTFNSAQTVTINCDTEDATIYYTTDGTEPTDENGKMYNGQLNIDRSTTVRAIAYKDGWKPSYEVEANFTLQVTTPEISPTGGTFDNTQNVTIYCSTTSAEIYYTTNGATPSTSSTKYNGQFTINKTTTVRAKAYKEG